MLHFCALDVHDLNTSIVLDQVCFDCICHGVLSVSNIDKQYAALHPFTSFSISVAWVMFWADLAC